MKNKKGFIIVIVITFMMVLVLAAWVIVDLGCGEALQTKKRNDLTKAYYVAVAGAERMYAHMKSLTDKTVIWPQARIDKNISANGVTIGSFRAWVYVVQLDAILGIVSEGTVNGQTVTVTVKYAYDSDRTTPLTAGCAGSMTLEGFREDPDKPNKTTYVTIEGPLSYGGSLIKNDYVNIVGEIVQDQDIQPVNFWLGNEYDTKQIGAVFQDDGTTKQVTLAQAMTQLCVTSTEDPKLDPFYANDVNDDNIIDYKDAFIYYYTVYLDSPTCPANTTGEHLEISPEEDFYYSGDQDFTTNSVPTGTSMIFVDGSVYINRSDTKWKEDDYSHTIVATGSVTIYRPVNDVDDTLTVIALGDVMMSGKDTGKQLTGNFIVWTKGDFIAEYGGKDNGAIMAEGDIIVQTLESKNKFDRYINAYKGAWAASLGLPPGYPITDTAFSILPESAGKDGYRPIWQRR